MDRSKMAWILMLPDKISTSPIFFKYTKLSTNGQSRIGEVKGDLAFGTPWKQTGLKVSSVFGPEQTQSL